MKRILLILLSIALIAIPAKAQDNLIESLLDGYSSKNGVEMVEISSQFLAMFVDKDKDPDGLTDKILSMKILSISNEDIKEHSSTIINDLRKALIKEKFVQVIKIKESKSLIEMYNKDNRFLVFLADDEDEGAVIYIKGSIDQNLIKAVMDGTISIE